MMPATLAAAQADPQGFVAGLNGPVILDEVNAATGLACWRSNPSSIPIESPADFF